jgi:diguanylate cyclase (GGDEF)-like protein/PAS domain S-box-containing protein
MGAGRELDADAWSAAIVHSTGDAIIGVQSDGTIASWNAGAEQLYGYAAAKVLGRPDTSLVIPECRPGLKDLRRRSLGGEIVSQVETEAANKNGERFPVAVTASPIVDEQGAIIGLSYVVRDISERRRFEHELQFLADHDHLTGLFNRRRFMQELARHIAFIKRYHVIGGALLVCDVDNLKYVNDSFGHRVGDELLKAVASVLRDRLRDTDVLGRLGGDEFAILLPRAKLSQATRVAEALRRAAAETELTAGGRAVRTSLSIGIGATTSSLSPEDVVAAGDRALYKAKRSGRDRIAVAWSQAG